MTGTRWAALAAVTAATAALIGCKTLLSTGSGQTGLLASSDATAPTSYETATYVRDVDGDTIMVEVEGERQRIRLIGIDCPESVAPQETGKKNTKEGKEASSYTSSLLSQGQTLYLVADKDPTDTYDRALRYVWLEQPTDARDTQEVGTKMLNGILCAQGYAKSHRYKPNTSYNDIFDELARQAKEQGLGVSATL